MFETSVTNSSWFAQECPSIKTESHHSRNTIGPRKIETIGLPAPLLWKLRRERSLGNPSISYAHLQVISLFSTWYSPSNVPRIPQSRDPLFYLIQKINYQSSAGIGDSEMDLKILSLPKQAVNQFPYLSSYSQLLSFPTFA